MKFRPLHDRVVVKRIAAEDQPAASSFPTLSFAHPDSLGAACVSKDDA